jgi:pimeloyl-ACP methyl ester carboxylesterase
VAKTWRFGKRRKRINLLNILVGIVSVLILGVAVLAAIPQGTPAIKVLGSEVANSIASLEKVKIGGLDQWILMRGHSEESPVVLFLHGGPGNPQIALARKFTADLETSFVVVNWDQRGGGKSWSDDIDLETMTVNQFVADTLELTNWLRERFNQDKIYLVGHSWGSYIGALAVQQQPELYHAYVGVGQMVSFEESEKLSYQYTLDIARSEGNAKAVAELEAIGSPPYKNGKEDVIVQRNWLARFGGLQREVNMTKEMVIAILTGREYTLYDAYRYLQGIDFSVEHLFGSLSGINLFEQVPALEVPVWFVSGKYDYITVASITRDYYEALQAPAKGFVLFERSAHMPLFEEPGKFAELMLKVLADTR